MNFIRNAGRAIARGTRRVGRAIKKAFGGGKGSTTD